jgi:hypothetical protein
MAVLGLDPRINPAIGLPTVYRAFWRLMAGVAADIT